MLIVIVTHFRTRTARHKPIVVRYVSFSCIAARHMFLITFRWFCTPKHFIPNPPPGKHKKTKRNEGISGCAKKHMAYRKKYKAHILK